jgi:hypothetical protein
MLLTEGLLKPTMGCRGLSDERARTVGGCVLLARRRSDAGTRRVELDAGPAGAVVAEANAAKVADWSRRRSAGIHAAWNLLHSVVGIGDHDTASCS